MPSTNSHVKVLPPRPLKSEETVHSVAQWKVNFNQYCKKDGAFKHFLKASMTCDKTKANAGFAETIQNRNPEQLQEELDDFLVDAGKLFAPWLHHRQDTQQISIF